MHYQLDVPSDAVGEIWVEAQVRRKFDQTYVDYVYPDGLEIELPITDLGVGRYPHQSWTTEDRSQLGLGGMILGSAIYESPG